MIKFYAGLPINSQCGAINGGHITTMFSGLVPTGRMETTPTSVVTSFGSVVAVEYWPGPNKTVALVDCPCAITAHNNWKSHGFKYDYEYRPHITICDGDETERYQSIVRTKFTVGSEYIRLFDKSAR